MYLAIILSLSVAKNILLQRQQKYRVWNDWYQKLLYCLCGNVWIDYIMIFGLEKENGSLITPMALTHPLHPIKSMSRNKRRNLWVGWCVSSWWPWFWPVYSIYCIHTTHYSRILTNQNKLFLRDIHTKSWCDHAGVLDDLILSGFRCDFSYMVQYSLCHSMDIGTMWHCTLVGSTPSQYSL